MFTPRGWFVKSQCKTEPDQNENATMDHFSLLPEQMNWTTSVKAPCGMDCQGSSYIHVTQRMDTIDVLISVKLRPANMIF